MWDMSGQMPAALELLSRFRHLDPANYKDDSHRGFIRGACPRQHSAGRQLFGGARIVGRTDERQEWRANSPKRGG